MTDTANPPRRKRSEVLKEKANSLVETYVCNVCKAQHPSIEAVVACKHAALYAGSHGPQAHALGVEGPEPDTDDDLFESVNAAKEPALPPGFQRIVERMVDSDPDGTYQALVAGIKLDVQQLNDKGRLREALNEAEDNARRAHLLYCNALVEQKRYDIDAEPVFGIMWTNAVEMLEQEAEQAEADAAEAKEKGRRKPPKKNITNEDVRAKASAMHPDAWRRHHIGQEKCRAMVSHLKEMSDQWSARCRTLEVLLSTMR